jgi:hypothetical protein
MKSNYGFDSQGKQIKLGHEVECIVTGFKGRAVGLYEYLHGCLRVNVQPVLDSEGKIPTDAVLDAPQLKIIGEDTVVNAEPAPKRLTIGEKATDTISGYKGIITCRASFLNGCHRVGISANALDKDGKVKETPFFDEPQVESFTAPAPKERQTSTGGPVSYRDQSRY